jgi:hypothetical protein
MKNTRGFVVVVSFVLSLLLPAMAKAQSQFGGTWKIDPSTAKLPAKPDVYLLQDGVYHCKTCVPPHDVKADGQDHKVSGDPYSDTMSVKVVDDRTIETTYKKKGKIVASGKTWVSADGNTLTSEFTDSSNTNSDPVTGKFEAKRVAKGPAGSHAISGSWRAAKVDAISDNNLVFTLKVSGDSLSFSAPTGQTYTAKLDGSDAPFKGDPGVTSVSVKRVNKNTLEETDKRDGKAIYVSLYTVSADGKTMTIKMDDKLHGTTYQFIGSKQ